MMCRRLPAIVPLFGLLMLNIAREACRRLNKTEDFMLHYALEGKPGR